MRSACLLAGLWSALPLSYAVEYSLEVASQSPYTLSVVNTATEQVVLSNTAILAGATNETTTPVDGDSRDCTISAEMITSSIAHVQVGCSLGYIGAVFGDKDEAKHYGVWAYPWDGSLRNTDIAFDLKGLQSNDGIKYSSARSPFFISSTGYAVYADTMQMGSYVFSSDKAETQFIFNTTSLDYYLILPENESDFKSLLTQYGSLTDKSALWSPQAYGPMFWHNDFQRESGWPEGVNSSQEFVEDVADKLLENRIPATTIMVDRPYGTGEEGWGNFDFDQEYWPDIEVLTSDLAKGSLDFQVWVANRAVPGSELHDEGTENDWMFEEMVTEEDAAIAYNLSIPEAYEYFKARMAYFPDVGVKGYKIDRGEEDEMPPWEQNIQAFHFHQLLFENQAERWGAPNSSKPLPFYSFARSLVDRSRKYTGVWNGDPDGTVDGLLASIKSGIRAGLLGFPMWGSDCGGYTREAQEESPLEDVWARWMWFSAFSPVYEVMLYEGSLPWYDYSDKLVEILRASAELHHELVPFIQSYMYQATLDGLPIIRALFLESPEDKKTWDVEDSYFFGEEFLIAPITGLEGSRDVYFPQGSKYLDYFDKKTVYEGGSNSTFALDIDSIPAFVREGAVVPRGDLYQVNNRWDEDWKPWLNIEVFPSYNVEHQSFPLYIEDLGRAVDIVVEADRKARNICVSYGPLGTEGNLSVYLEGGPREFKFKRHGGRQCVEDAKSLFV